MCGTLIALLWELNFLAESVPESRNLRLKFQHFSGVTVPDWNPLREVATPSRANLNTVISGRPYAGASAHGTVTQTVMLWGVPFFNRMKWQPYFPPRPQE